jgi:hypothetical protein
MYFNVYGGVITGCHRFDIHNGVTAGTYAAIVAGMIAALTLGGGLNVLAAVYLAGTLAGEIVRRTMAFRVCPELEIRLNQATVEDIRKLLSFGGKTVVDNLSRLLLAQASSILVAAHLGPAALAVFARPNALVRQTDTLTNKFAMVLSPAASSLSSTGRAQDVRELLVDATKFAAFVAMPVTVFLAIMGEPILQVWMGPRYREGLLMVVIALGSFLPLTQRPAQHIMIGMNAHGRIGWASFAVAWIGVGAAVLVLGPLHQGLVGAAMALVVPYTLGNGLFVLIYACRKVGIPVHQHIRRSFAGPALCALPLVAALLLVRFVFADAAILALLVAVAVSCAILLPLYWRFVLPPGIRSRILTRARTIVPRLRAPAAEAPFIQVNDLTAAAEREAEPQADVRALPYPYQAALAICSDLDETPDRHVYLETARFLNTTEITSMGRGVGLEVGNTIYFDMPPDQFAYWNTDDAGRDMVHALIRSGHIDCLHSFGDFASTRGHAARALDALDASDCRLEVWIDHAVAPSNFGADIMKGSGDLPDAAAYHADLTCAAGVRYVWRGRVTSVIGQNVRRSVRGIWNPRKPLASLKTAAKEEAKGVLARTGGTKYGIHGANRVLGPATLRDGQPVYEFLRCNPHWGGVSRGETAREIAQVLTPGMIDRLVARRATSILYTHLGKIGSRREPLGPEARAAFRHLAERRDSGDVMVTTTRRLLGYCAARERVSATTRTAGSETHVRVTVRPDVPATIAPADMDGLTFYVDDPCRARIFVNGQEVVPLQRNPADHTGRPSVSIPRRPLSFPRVD